VTGPTGPGGAALAVGNCYSDYLYWNSPTTVGAWTPGGQEVHIGCGAAQTTPAAAGSRYIAIGYNAGQTSITTGCIAIGDTSGNSSQQQYAIAIGRQAGQTTQGGDSIAIGRTAGRVTQGANAIAIGYQAGLISQPPYSIVIGDTAASVVANAPGADSIAIGKNASANAAYNDTITLSAAPPPFSLEPSGTNRTHIYPIRQDYRDSILIYDDPSYNNDTSTVPVNPPQYNRYEINTACYGMPLYTFLPPEHIDQSANPWVSYTFTAITQGFPFTAPSFPFCQRNVYEYYIVDCNTNPPRLVDKALSLGETCRSNSNVSIRPCPGGVYFAVVQADSNKYNECCIFNGYWWYGSAGPEETMQQTWSATVAWLNDPRSLIPAGTIDGIDKDTRLLLLVANHTV
jgi:hypothetical protein